MAALLTAAAPPTASSTFALSSPTHGASAACHVGLSYEHCSARCARAVAWGCTRLALARRGRRCGARARARFSSVTRCCWEGNQPPVFRGRVRPPPPLFTKRAWAPRQQPYLRRTCRQRHPSHKRHPSHAHLCGRAQSRGAQRSPPSSSLLLSGASPSSREDAHRPGGGRAAQRALGPGLLRGAAEAQAQVRARQQQDGARFLCGQIEQYVIVSQR